MLMVSLLLKQLHVLLLMQLLQGNIDAEETARIAGDTALQGNIDALSGAVASDLGFSRS
jgi:hypothetical protein